MKTGKGPIALSDEARDRVSEQLHARYVATIVGRLCEVGTLDLAAADLPIRVVDRPIDDFRTDPSLDLARYVRDVLVDRATYLDERSFRLEFTESDLNLGEYVLHGDGAVGAPPLGRGPVGVGAALVAARPSPLRLGQAGQGGNISPTHGGLQGEAVYKGIWFRMTTPVQLVRIGAEFI